MKKNIKDFLLAEGFRPFPEMSYEAYLPYQGRIECCNLTYVTLFAYNEYYPYFVKETENGLIISGEGIDTDFDAFCVIISLQDEKLFPLYEEAAALYKKTSFSMCLVAMDEKYAKMLENHPLTESIRFTEDDSDYVYDIAEFLNLEGGKNAKKRRDINKTTNTYSNIRIKTIHDFQAEKDTIMHILGKWCESYDCDKCLYGCEEHMIRNILNSGLAKHLYGAIMYIDDVPEMFAISQIIGDTCYLYFKKSTDRLAGTFYYFEYHFLQPVKNLKYVNFEEDMGLPGLREYKRRRHPAKMIDKYEIRIKGMKSKTGSKTNGTLIQASEEDKAFLTDLWQEAFGDSEEYIHSFFDLHLHTKDGGRAFLWKENGQPVTMLFALPATIHASGRETKARYLYAIATKKEYRGRKYLKKILPELKKVFAEECVLFLVPEPEVIPYYESLGLALRQGLPGFSIKREECGISLRGMDAYPKNAALSAASIDPLLQKPSAASQDFSMQEITDAALYKEIRDAHLENRDCILWGQDEISFALKDLSLAQGKAYLVNCRFGRHLLAGYFPEKDNCFEIIETTLSEKELTEIGAEIMDALRCMELSQKQLCYMIENEADLKYLYLSLALNN